MVTTLPWLQITRPLLYIWHKKCSEKCSPSHHKFESWWCHSQPWPGAQDSKIGRALRLAYSLVPINHRDTSQSWGYACENGPIALSSECLTLLYDIAWAVVWKRCGWLTSRVFEKAFALPGWLLPCEGERCLMAMTKLWGKLGKSLLQKKRKEKKNA